MQKVERFRFPYSASLRQLSQLQKKHSRNTFRLMPRPWPNLSLPAVEVFADVLLDLDEAHLALGVPATLVLLLPRGVAPLELAPGDGCN